MRPQNLPPEFIQLCQSVTAKRPRTVINHILEYGFITTEELKTHYGYNHPPRAIRDVKEQGIPIEMFRVTGSDGRSIAAYKFGDPATARSGQLKGRTAFSRGLKQRLVALDGARCVITLEPFDPRDLQIDHRVPYEVAGDNPNADVGDYMLLSASANRAKSWSCEHCVNWLELKDKNICKTCYWAYPEDYAHIAMLQIRRVDIVWQEEEAEIYDRLKQKTTALQQDIPTYVKAIIREHLDRH